MELLIVKLSGITIICNRLEWIRREVVVTELQVLCTSHFEVLKKATKYLTG
jgi:hypothetical protein